MATAIEPGKIYLGPFNARMLILSVEGGVVKAMFCSSLREIETTVDEAQAWASESEERIYYPDDYSERRTKIYEGRRGDYGAMPDADDPNGHPVDPEEEIVAYRETETGATFIVSKADWLEWRNSLPA